MQLFMQLNTVNITSMVLCRVIYGGMRLNTIIGHLFWGQRIGKEIGIKQRHKFQ